MKKVSTILLMAAMLFAVSVNYEAPAKKIASVELSKIEKSYSANSAPAPADNECFVLQMGIYQDDVYYSETTAVDNYTLPVIEDVYIEPAAPVPLIAA